MALTNGQVYSFLKANGKKKCFEYLKDNDNRLVKPTEQAFDYHLNKLCKACLNFAKTKSRPSSKEKYEQFLSESFQFPQVHEHKKTLKVTSDESLDIRQSLRDQKEKTLMICEKFLEVSEENRKAQGELEAKKDTLKSVRLKLKRTSARESYAHEKIKRLEENVNKECCEVREARIKYLEQQLRNKDLEIGELRVSCEYLQDLINENIVAKRTLDVYDEESKRYTPMFKQCVYEILQHNVSASKVSAVVSSVLKLANIEANKLPSKPTVLEMNLQRLCLAQEQLIEVFSSKENTTLLTDETSQFGTRFMGYEAADGDGNLWVLGIREIETKSADNTLNVFKEILFDLDEKSEQANNQITKDILCHISATMSDRAATEVKFNSLLEQFRKETLPLIFHQYNNFTEEEQASVETLSNFFCGLHALVNFAETTQKCSAEVENTIFSGQPPILDKQFSNNAEPGTCRLIRTASKAFGEGSHGDQKSGCQGNFQIFVKEFLTEHHLKSVPLRSYRGSRFNVLFSNAASVFFLHEKMIEFLEKNGTENRLLKSVLFDLKTTEYLAGIKALGLISTFITCPLWSVLEDRNVSIIDMNNNYLELINYFIDSANNLDDFITGNLILNFGEDRIKKDAIYHSLIQPRDYDQIVQTYLEIILAALCQLGQKLYKDHLPGGSHTSLTEEQKEKLKGVPKTSVFAESMFGQLDYLIRTKPNLSTLAAEACIMFVNNKTLDWLKSKDENSRNALIKAASKGVSSLRAKFKTRLKEIDDHRRLALQEKIAQKENQDRERLRKQEEYTNSIVRHGLWQSEREIDDMITTYETNAEKVNVLKTQLRFRKEVLKQVADDKSVFNFTKSVDGKKSRKSLGPEELINNLKTLVRQAIVKDTENNSNRHMLVGRRVRHRQMVEEDGLLVGKWYTGKVISQVPAFPKWFNIVYDNEPETVYTYHRLDADLEQTDLQILF